MTTAETIAGFPAITHGRGTPVVMLHGAFADHIGFEHWVDRIGDAGFRAVAFARRGRCGVGPAREGADVRRLRRRHACGARRHR